jgi:oxygen-independent coproporphyrinogen III oxidase
MDQQQKFGETMSRELDEMILTINGSNVAPTRDEFYTNYPFFKYWKMAPESDLVKDPGINLYIHIPFCIQICDYCFYAKELVKSKDQVDEYVDFLCKEIELACEHYNLKNRKVNSIYVGGGTPSVLTESQFGKLMETLHHNHNIQSPEFTFEAEPGTFSLSKLNLYKDGGINRISMGVQSFDDEIIKISSRKHTSRQAANSISMIRELGGFSINIDLLSGLAGETMESWETSINTALGQPIDMLTIYKMKVYANTNVFKDAHQQQITLPSKELEIEFMKKAMQMLKTSEFKPWTNFAYSKNGYKHMYAENTWRGQDLIAYGVSSFGKVGNKNFQNLNTTKFYFEKIKNGRLPIYRQYPLTIKDQIVKELLLCSARLSSYSKKEFVEKFGFDFTTLIPTVMTDLISKGYVEDNDEDLVLTEQGLLFGDFVGQVLASAVKDVLGKDQIGFTY